jgi:hypothetical protein
LTGTLRGELDEKYGEHFGRRTMNLVPLGNARTALIEYGIRLDDGDSLEVVAEDARCQEASDTGGVCVIGPS